MKQITRGFAIYYFVSMLFLMGIFLFTFVIMLATGQPFENYILIVIVFSVLIFTFGIKTVKLWNIDPKKLKKKK